MATKAFYKAKKDHMRPMRNIYARAIRALERDVPIGRGHAWQLPPQPGDLKRRFPNWRQHAWTKDIAAALKDNQPAGFGVTQDRRMIREVKFRYETYLEKFLRRHPQVAWKVPYNPFSNQEWAPVIFAKRWQELVDKEKLSEDEAYMAVVNEGGGGGDWNGVWQGLEHDRVKNVLKTSTPNLPVNQKRQMGFSLLRSYQEARLADAKIGVQRAIWGLKSPTVSKVEKLLDEKMAEAADGDFTRDMLDLGVLFKLRAIKAKKAEEIRRSKANEGSDTR